MTMTTESPTQRAGAQALPALRVEAPAQKKLLARAGFPLLLALVILAGLARSYVATAADGLTIDEAWHAVAASSYVQTGDFRLNPEHPPLMKLWVGSALGEGAFKLPPFRPLADKEDERALINQAFYLENDPDVAHERARVAMLAFHGVLLLALGLTLRAIFGAALALVTTALFLLEPTVAAHLPAVLTDLPLALTSALAVLLGWRAFRSFRPRDLALAALALGLALGAKHSGLVTGAGFALLAAGQLCVGFRRLDRRTRLTRVGQVLGVLLGAYAVLWSLYGFRYAEGAHGETTQIAADGSTQPLFNRALEDKIHDLQSPLHRSALTLAVQLRVLPRAYLWGLADIVRAAVDGRQETLYVYGHHYEGDTPWFFFPAVLTAKVPLGLSLLFALGLALLARRRVPEAWRVPAWIALGWGAFFLLALMRNNSGYAGIRHAAPVLAPLALVAAMPLVSAWSRGSGPSRGLRVASLLGLAGLLISALPVRRPWEYYNELVGGAASAWRAFTDDGLDNGQRSNELAAYYHAHVAPGEAAYDFYTVFEEEQQTRGLRFAKQVAAQPGDDTLTGTMFVSARWMAPRDDYDLGMFRAAEPTARFGNLLVFRGTFRFPWLAARTKRGESEDALALGTPEGRARAEGLLEEVVALYPADFRSSFELGNLRLERGERAGAADAYRIARDHTQADNPLAALLDAQLAALAAGAPDIEPIRNPWLE